MSGVEAETWATIQALASRFRKADRIIVGFPMWNFAYPYKLKQLIDLASQRNLMFSFDGKAYGPLLRTPKALVIYTRGGDYQKGSSMPVSRFDHILQAGPGQSARCRTSPSRVRTEGSLNAY